VVFDVVFEGLVTKVDPHGFVRVSQPNGRVKFAVMTNAIKHHS
jgi:hypothetical protein